MARYNHFSEVKYKQISYLAIQIGGKFRMDKGNKRRIRRDVVMVKLGVYSYQELKSKQMYCLIHPDKLTVSSYDELNEKDK